MTTPPTTPSNPPRSERVDRPWPRILLGPGPSDVPPRVLAALASPTIGHLDPEYLRIMDETRGLLQRVFATKNKLTLAVSGTGSAGMEACVANLIEPGDEVIVCVNGVVRRAHGGRGRTARRAPSTWSRSRGDRPSTPRPSPRR